MVSVSAAKGADRSETSMAPKRTPAATPTQTQASAATSPYNRVVVKAGTALLTRGADRIDHEVMADLVEQMARLHALGTEVILVSSGAVAAGRQVLGGATQGVKGLPLRQMLAAVGQGHLMHLYQQVFGDHGIRVGQALLSRRDLTDRLGYLNVRNTLLALVECRVVPIVNENDVVAVEELAEDAFGDNDTLSALVTNLVDADLLVLLGDVEGLYTADPNLDQNAHLIPTVERVDRTIEMLGGPSTRGGRGGMATKVEAARLATTSGARVVIASGLEPDALIRLAHGEELGTHFPPSRTRIESRKRWMLSGLSTRGEIAVDDGAVAALRRRNRSLLPAGVTEVLGSFDRGDIVAILDAGRNQVACGIANYGSEDLARIRGLHSGRIAEVLGHEYGDEVVHRSNMVTI